MILPHVDTCCGFFDLPALQCCCFSTSTGWCYKKLRGCCPIRVSILKPSLQEASRLLKYQPPEIWTQLLEELGSDGFELKGDQFSKPRSCILYSSDSSTGMQEKLCGHCASLSKKETKNDSIPKLPRTVRPHMLSPNSFLLHPVPCEWTGKFFYRSLQLQSLGGKQSNFEEKLWPAEH